MKEIQSNIEQIGTIQELTLSKKSNPGDGSHARGVKGDHS